MSLLSHQQLQSFREDFQTLYKSSQKNDLGLFSAAAAHFIATLEEVQANAAPPIPKSLDQAPDDGP